MVYNRKTIPESEIFVMNILRDKMLENSILIHCTAQGEFSNKPYYPKDHFSEITEDYNELVDMYDYVMCDTNCIEYNFKEKSFEQLVREIINA